MSRAAHIPYETSPTPSFRCKVCRARGHIEAECERAKTGLQELVARATRISEGRRYLVAEVIGVSEAGLSRALAVGRLSFELRARLVDLVRGRALPEADPPRRPPGRRPRRAAQAQSVMLYFDTAGAAAEFVRLGRAHRAGRIGVLVDAARAYRAVHARPPSAAAAPPRHGVRCRIPKTELELRLELVAFDDWIGGAELRPRVIANVLGEYCQHAAALELGGRVLALPQGTVEVYAVTRRGHAGGMARGRAHGDVETFPRG